MFSQFPPFKFRSIFGYFVEFTGIIGVVILLHCVGRKDNIGY